MRKRPENVTRANLERRFCAPRAIAEDGEICATWYNCRLHVALSLINSRDNRNLDRYVAPSYLFNKMIVFHGVNMILLTVRVI